MLSLLGFQTPVFYLWVTQHWMMEVDLGYVTPHPYWLPHFLKLIKGAHRRSSVRIVLKGEKLEVLFLKSIISPGFRQSARLFVFTLLDLTNMKLSDIWVRKKEQFLLFVNNCLSRKSRRFFRHTFRSLLNITKATEYYKVC